MVYVVYVTLGEFAYAYRNNEYERVGINYSAVGFGSRSSLTRSNLRI